MKKLNRHSIVDLWRFVGCLLIMSFHLYFTGIALPDPPYPFYTAWIYVEFFFILSGYYTISHFDKLEKTSIDDMAKNSLFYTAKKYFRFFPYIIIATSIYYFVDYLSMGFSLSKLIDYIFDASLLTGSFYEAYLAVSPLWFLSVMFIVFPFFCFLCQMKSKHILYMLAFYMPLIYYGYTARPSLGYFPYSVPRALAALFLGVFIYALSRYIGRNQFSTIQKVLLTCAEIFSLLSVVYFTYISELEHYRFFILCFSVGLTIMLSQQSYTAKIDSSIFRWLGKISMPMYILHTMVAHCIAVFHSELPDIIKIIIYYAGTFLVSIIAYWSVETVRRKVGGGKGY